MAGTGSSAELAQPGNTHNNSKPPRVVRFMLVARPRVVVDDDAIILQPSRDVIRDVDSKRYGHLRHERLIYITIRDPDYFPGVVIVGCQDLRDVDGAAALIHQFALQHVSVQAVFADRLVADGNYRISAGRD